MTNIGSSETLGERSGVKRGTCVWPVETHAESVNYLYMQHYDQYYETMLFCLDRIILCLMAQRLFDNDRVLLGEDCSVSNAPL